MKKLPTLFLEAMQSRLEDQFDAFLASYEYTPYAGLRVNTLKWSVDEFQARSPFELRPIPWTTDGFYVEADVRPGKHPYYHAGCYYIQEPSAMAPVELLDVQPNDRVLDLCAAPGGKSVQIAARLGKRGVLVTNDLHPDRTKALVKNMELYGVRNAVVLNERPERIAEAFPQFFDKVLVDAPCSGEGMFRKDPDMVKSWEREPVLTYAAMQADILRSAGAMVAPGGRLVYSTCTFAPEENEVSIARFLTEHPEFRVVPMEARHGFAHGRPDWASATAAEHGFAVSAEAVAATAGTLRLWPHLLEGEGHYVAVLERAGVANVADATNVAHVARVADGVDVADGTHGTDGAYGTHGTGSTDGTDDTARTHGTDGTDGIDGAKYRDTMGAHHEALRSSPKRASEREAEGQRLRKKGFKGTDKDRGSGNRNSNSNSNSNSNGYSNANGGKKGGNNSPKRNGAGSARASSSNGNTSLPPKKGLVAPIGEQLDIYAQFCREHFVAAPAQLNAAIGPYVYDCPLPLTMLQGLRVARPGLFLGTCKGERFEPAHALALAITAEEAARVLPYSLDADEIKRYLRGETLTPNEEQLQLQAGTSAKGYVLVTVDGLPLGFAKWAGGILKNEYPAAWRWT
ncbi:RsmB/NOP family class I SAM-dependent RNA methyltransferase [Paenibacillus sp. 481]|uniref:RsmB/NOP family class I SAM-dependent RNA methyltransferase n=1 Tax=Paenibacillus sp. 481 TaxID=2835869 RepID=UPI003FA6C807